MARVQIPFGFQFPGTVSSTTVLEPVVGAAVTVTNRDTSTAATLFAAETGGTTIGSLTTDASGSIPACWVIEGSYLLTVAAAGAFAGASIAWEAVRGDGVGNVAAGAVSLAALTASVAQALLPTGTIIQYAGSSVPTGFLACNGQVVSQTTYAMLFAAIGTTWNTGGEGAGNFRVPDTRGRVLLNNGAGTGLTNRLLGAIGGEETHVLSTGEMPAHGHNAANGSSSTGDGGAVSFVTSSGTATSAPGSLIFPTGSGTAHNNMQPWAVINGIIKT